MANSIEPASSQEITVDDVVDLTIRDSLFRCTLVSQQQSEGHVKNVEVARLAVPVSKLPDIIQKFVIALTQAAKTIVRPPLS